MTASQSNPFSSHHNSIKHSTISLQKQLLRRPLCCDGVMQGYKTITNNYLLIALQG